MDFQNRVLLEQVERKTEQVLQRTWPLSGETAVRTCSCGSSVLFVQEGTMVPTGQPEAEVCPAVTMALGAGLKKKKKKLG